MKLMVIFPHVALCIRKDRNPNKNILGFILLCWSIFEDCKISFSEINKVITDTLIDRYDWFVLFNGISTLFMLFNTKAILLEEQ